MNKVFEKFANEINFTITPSFASAVITKAQLIDGVFNINFQNKEVIPFNQMVEFLKKINTFKYKCSFNFDIELVIFEQENIKQYIVFVLRHLLKNPSLATVFEGSETKVSPSGKVTVKLLTDTLMAKFENIEEKLVVILHKLGLKGLKMIFLAHKGADLLANEAKKIASEVTSVQEQMENSDPKPNFERKFYGYSPVEIHQLAESNFNNVLIKGEIFDKNIVNTKSGLKIFQFSLTDYQEAVYAKAFARGDDQFLKLNDFNKGDYVEVKGQYQLDSFTKEPTILIKSIVFAQNANKSRNDTYAKTRVELSTRTQMSTMDGIISAKSLIERAQSWKHQAIAIVDENSVQSFPEFYHASKEVGVKPIYGVSLTALHHNAQAIYNPQGEQALENQEYVVFDLETTGLSPILNDIIEFGAVKIVNNEVVDRKQFFLKPTHPIPQHISDITGITNVDVADAKIEAEAIKDIHQYLQGAVMVAHNATFDYNFINEKFEKYNLEKLHTPCIDTLVTARIIFAHKKRFSLQAVSSLYQVAYDTSVAHRADYDADVLAKIWLKMLSDLKQLNILSQKQLFDYQADHLYAKAFSKEITILAKNQAGLKELFQYVSLAMTKNIFKKPITFFEHLKPSKNILIGSGALKSWLVDYMLTGSHEQIRQEIARYDYIEVQPLQNFAHKFRDYTKTGIEKLLKIVIDEAKKQGKIIVATGDVRYLDHVQKVYHEVYINAKGLGGVRHYLYRYNDDQRIYPDQHFLTTKEMMQEFAFLKDKTLIKEIVLDNSCAIADQIDDNIMVIKDQLYTPTFEDADQKLATLVYKNAYHLYGDPLPTIVKERIEREIEPIKKYGFSVIYWISHLLVGKSLNDGYLVGSRGSVGSSFVATMAKITEVNPLEPHYLCKNSDCKFSQFNVGKNLNSGYDLPDKLCPNCQQPLAKEGQKIPFETFLGFEANKVPDIDLNFSGEYQPIIHQEVKNLFGETHSFRAGTISTVAEKTAFGYVRAWAEDTNQNISRAFTEFLAKGVAGTKRTTGQHPGGIIVIPQEFNVEDFSPINFPANDVSAAWKTTHFDFHAIHDNVLKLDLLGHDDPTAIKYLEKLTGVNVKTDIPFWDEKIIKLFSSTEPLGILPQDIGGEKTGAMGIPEFGTTFVRRMLKKAQVKSFGDLISVSGLSHGTDVWTGNAEVVIKNFNKELNDVISCRDNIMTDLMAKGIESLTAFNIMEKVRKGYGLSGEEEKLLKSYDVEQWYIDSLKKIKYMFPKAHATAYVMMAWRIAWFKLYHPSAYYATYFTTRANFFDISTIIAGKEAVQIKLVEFKGRKNKRGTEALTNKEVGLMPILEIALEAFARGIVIQNISLINSHDSDWIINQDGSLTPPFSTIDGLGEAVALSIIKARAQGDFKSVEDLQNRTSLNKTNIEKLRNMNVLKHLSERNQVSLFDDIF